MGVQNRNLHTQIHPSAVRILFTVLQSGQKNIIEQINPNFLNSVENYTYLSKITTIYDIEKIQRKNFPLTNLLDNCFVLDRYIYFGRPFIFRKYRPFISLLYFKVFSLLLVNLLRQ